MLYLGLGTGLGATLIIDGVVEPTEVGPTCPTSAAAPSRITSASAAASASGTPRWRKTVRKVIADLNAAFETEYIVLGGGTPGG